MESKQVQLYLDREKMIEASPVTSADCVMLTDGNNLQKVLNNDLTTPTVAHEESSFKTGVGDIDVSSSVVDGEVGRMVIKGKTYQNILPEPSTHVLTNNKEMFKVNEGLDPNVEIVDGVSKSAILSGQTLVNVSGEPIVNLVINSSSPKYLGQHILKKDTMYTFIYDIEEVTGDASGCWGRFNYTDGSFKNVLDKVYTTGTTKVVTSFDKDLNNIYIGWIRNHVVGQSVKFKSVMILEGDWTDKEIPPYFDGMQSVNFYPDQTVTKLVWKAGQYYGDNGQLTTVSANQNHRYIDEYVKISPNMTYRVSGNNNYKNLNFYDENKNHLLKVTSTSQLGNGALTGDIVATAPNNAKYLRYNMAVGDNLTESTIIYNDTIGIPLASTSISETYTHKMPVLCTTGKNLFDSSTEIVTGQGINSSNGLPYNYPTHSRTGFLRVKPNTSYTITQSHNKTWVFAYDKNKEYIKVVKTDITSGGNFTTPNDTHYIRLDFNTVDTSEIVNGVQIEEGTVATSYEPYKSNILHTPEEVVLREVNGVQDTLNLNAREWVQRIGEVVLDGGNNYTWSIHTNSANTIRFQSRNIPIPAQTNQNILPNILCDKLKVVENVNWQRDEEQMEIGRNAGSYEVNIRIAKAKLSGETVEALKTYLQSNPITVQYVLASPVIKTVDLSSSGNWEKVVLNGSENWLMTNNTHFYTKLSNELSPNALLPIIDNSLFTPKDNSNSTANAVWYGGNVGDKNGNIVFNVLDKTLEQFKQYLSQNPITVWYQTTNHKDSTQVKQPIFFKDGHIQLSSGADNSLIPTLDYEAKTSNSYVMDLMKANTRYTMKAKSASGTFTIDGTSYGAGTNGTFTSPTSMTNKLLVMSNKTNEEVMILEGDVTSKAIPYFKGIKSAFEDESKIEVLSTGKNLFIPENHVSLTKHEGYWSVNKVYTNDKGVYYKLKPNTKYILSFDKYGTDSSWIGVVVNGVYRNNGNANYIYVFNTDSTGETLIQIGANTQSNVGHTICNIQLEESPTATSYEPYKSNTTKIPLLSPLRSLPNGVCDELIIDRMKKKATLIQRIKTVTFDGSSDESWGGYNDSGTRVTQGFYHNVSDPVIASANVNLYCDTLQPNINAIHTRNGRGVGTHNDGSNNKNIRLCLLKNELIPYGFSEPLKTNENVLRKWLQDNPTTVCYELATPVVTEIDLENFPLVYKDGHIFLNSEIAPVVEINYNVNQSQQIQANNETLQRHELDILDLDNLIVSFVNAEYNLRLLKFNMELSMMALAE